MDFPLVDLLGTTQSVLWLETYFHPQGLCCPKCQEAKTKARVFRHSKRGLVDYRCNSCHQVYNLYSGTLFAGSPLSPAKVVLLLRGICKGESSLVLARELQLSRTTVHTYRKKVQQNAYTLLEQNALPDTRTETDEMFQNAGEKRAKTP